METIDLNDYEVNLFCASEMSDEWGAVITRKSDNAEVAEFEFQFACDGDSETNVVVNVKCKTTGNEPKFFNAASAFLFWPMIDEAFKSHFE